MKTFFLKLLLFGLAVFIVDKAFIIVRDQAPEHDYDKRLEMVLNGRVNKDLIILGSSRGESDIDAEMIEDSLDIDVFNLSYGGAPLEFQDFVLDMLLKFNDKPKYILKVIDDDFEIMHNKDGTRAYRYDRLYPLVKYPEVRDELIRKGEKSEWLSKLFVLHQLNRSNFDFRTPPANELKDTIFGSRLYDKHDDSINWIYSESPDYDYSMESEMQAAHFKSIQEKCEKAGIQLIFVTAPVFRKMSATWLARMEELMLPATQLLVHDQNEVQFKNERFYSDLNHLNKPGAAIYTNSIIRYLRENTEIAD